MPDGHQWEDLQGQRYRCSKCGGHWNALGVPLPGDLIPVFQVDPGDCIYLTCEEYLVAHVQLS